MSKKGTKKETLKEAHERNQRAFLRLRKKLAETHNGQWIGLVGGEVVAIAPTLDELEEELQKIERHPGRAMVFQAGEPYPVTDKALPILPIRW
jgi:hypothetical protein